jgi:UV DNA damage endonuclease
MKNSNRLGYACINLSLGKNVTSNRSMTKKTFLQKGKSYASELALLNTTDLVKIMEWNRDNGITFYRASSDIIPWMSEFDLVTLPDWKEIESNFRKFGLIARENDIRVEFHPGHFTILCSQKQDVVLNAIDDIEKHSQMLDAMGYLPGFDNDINIHIGASYGDKPAAAKSWCEGWHLLSDSAKKRIVIENDDKESMYSVRDLYEMVHKEVGVPITFDHFHHVHCPGGMDAKDAAHLAASTWPSEVDPVQHYSSSRRNNEDPAAKPQAHADWVYEMIDPYVENAWVMVESKMKDLSIIKYNKEFNETASVIC